MKNVDTGVNPVFLSRPADFCPAFPVIRVGAIFKIQPFRALVKLTFSETGYLYRNKRQNGYDSEIQLHKRKIEIFRCQEK